MLDIVKLKFEFEYPLTAVLCPPSNWSGAGHFRPCTFWDSTFLRSTECR